MKKRLLAALLTVTAMVASMPTTAFAATETLNPSTSDSFEVLASADVTHDDLAALGMNVVVSMPVEVGLTLNGSDFSGSDKIYAYGIMDMDSTLSVTIDDANEVYGVVKYRATEAGEASVIEADYYNEVSESLSKESFAATETRDNYLAQKGSEEMTNLSTLNVSIKSLIPVSGTGEYFTNIPLMIAVQ